MGACLTLSVMLAPIGMDKALHARRAQSSTSTAHGSPGAPVQRRAARRQSQAPVVLVWPVVPSRSPSRQLRGASMRDHAPHASWVMTRFAPGGAMNEAPTSPQAFVHAGKAMVRLRSAA